MEFHARKDSEGSHGIHVFRRCHRWNIQCNSQAHFWAFGPWAVVLFWKIVEPLGLWPRKHMWTLRAALDGNTQVGSSQSHAASCLHQGLLLPCHPLHGGPHFWSLRQNKTTLSSASPIRRQAQWQELWAACAVWFQREKDGERHVITGRNRCLHGDFLGSSCSAHHHMTTHIRQTSQNESLKTSQWLNTCSAHVRPEFNLPHEEEKREFYYVCIYVPIKTTWKGLVLIWRRNTQLCCKQESHQQQSVTTFYQQPKLWPRENGRDKWHTDSNFLHEEENRY